MSKKGMGASMSIEGSSDTESFSLYMREFLCPSLERGQIVIMDNLSVHKSKRVEGLIEEAECELMFLPPYSPDLNPIEEAFSKVKGILRKTRARTKETLVEATGQALDALSRRDIHGFYADCGYRPALQSF